MPRGRKRKVKEFPFVGRLAEIEQGMQLLSEACMSAEPFSIFITGERGIGKTRFIRELASRAQELGYQVEYHQCEAEDRYRPFATLSALVRLLLGKPQGWAPRNVKTLKNAVSKRFPDFVLSDQDAELLLWLLDASRATKNISLLDERSRRGMVTTLFDTFLIHQLRNQPFLLMAVDNIHLSDYLSGSHLLASTLPRGIVLVASAPSLSTIGQEEANELPLPPFTEREVKQLVSMRFGKKLPAEQVNQRLLETTQGNPLHLVQLLASVPLDEDTPATLFKILEERRSNRVSEAALHRLEPLDTSSTTLIKYASVIADRFPLLILSQMLSAKFPVDKALRNLSRLRLAWVEANADGRDLFCFEHTTVREAAYSLLGDVEKERLHTVAVTALKRYHGKHINEHLMSIAHHYEKAGDRESAADTHSRAGDYFVKIGDFFSAEETYKAAEQLFEDENKKLEVMAEHIAALGAQSKTDECQEISDRFFAGSPSLRLQAKVLANLARVHATTGSLHKAAECARKAIELAEQSGEQEELSKACNYLAYTLALMGQIEEAYDYGNRAHKLAEELGDDRLMGGALQALAGVNWAAGDLQKAKRLFELAADKFRKVGHLYNVAVMKINLGATLQAMGVFKGALESYSEAADLHERMGATTSLGIAKSNTAIVLMDLGRYRECLSLLESSAPFFKRLKSPALAGLVMLVKANCLVRTGKIEDALPLLEEGWKAQMQAGHWSNKALVVDALIRAAVLTGNMEKALDESKEFLEEVKSREAGKSYHEALLLRLRALLAAERLDEAEHIAQQIEERVSTEQNLSVQAAAKALLACLAASKGDFRKAEDLFEEALATGRLGNETRAQANLRIGEAMLNAGQSAKARQYLEKAREDYTALVASGYRKHELNRIEELLAKIPL